MADFDKVQVGLTINIISGANNTNPRAVNMKKIHLFIKSMVLITALIFASNASAGGRQQNFDQVQFQFQFQFQSNGSGSYGKNGNRPTRGHWHKDKYGNSYFHTHVAKPKPKPTKYYKLNSKKSFKRLMKRRGYHRVHNIKRTSRYYEATAINRKGHKVWVRFSRKTARLRHRKVLVWNAYR